MTKLQYF